jgi:aconitate hydratase
VLTITEMLRKHGVVGKFVEFYGEGVAAVPLANRATIGNMSPEYGSTCAIFPIDEETSTTCAHRPRRGAGRARRGLRQGAGLWHDPSHEPVFSEYLELDLSTSCPRAIAGPKRPQDRVELSGQGGVRARAALTTYATDGAADDARGERRGAADRAVTLDGDGRRDRPRRRRDRRDHLVHQHVQPVGDDRRRLLAKKAVERA